MTDQNELDLGIDPGIEDGWLGDREFTAEQRQKAEESGAAMCLAGETLVRTLDGDRSIASLAGQSVELLSRDSGGHARWITSDIAAFGHQRLYRIRLINNFNAVADVFATAQHRWYLGETGRSVTYTVDLRPGDTLTPAWNDGEDPSVHPMRQAEATQLPLLRISSLQGPEILPPRMPRVPQSPSAANVREKVKTQGRAARSENAGLHSLPDQEVIGLDPFPDTGRSTQGWHGSSVSSRMSRLHTQTSPQVCQRAWSPGPLFRETETLWSDLGGVQCDIGSAGAPMCTLQATREISQASSGPLPRDGRDTRTALHELQSCAWQNGRYGRRGPPRSGVPLWSVASVTVSGRVEETYCAIVPETACFVLAGDILTGNSGGGFPIHNREDLMKARKALGRAKNRKATIAHIKKRAKALGVDLPEGWPDSSDADPFACDSHMLRDGQSYSVTDTIVIDRKSNSINRRSDGYLVATPRVARTGIQLYQGRELDDERPMLRVYRPPESVFARDSIETFSSRPITSDHPYEMVTADNWRQHAVGYTGEDILRDGEFVRVPMTLCDAQTIRDFETGKRQLSVGYTCDIEFKDGKTDDGEEYDAVQRNIRVNHVAFVASARGGEKLAFGDGNLQEVDMSTKNLTLDGTSMQVPEHIYNPIKRALDAKDALIAKLMADQSDPSEPDEDDMPNGKRSKKKAEEDAATIATLTKQMDELKAKLATELSPAAMDARIHELADVQAKARTILGDNADFAGKDVGAIRRAVVLSRIGDEAAQWSDDAIAASFRTLTREPTGTGYRDAAATISAGLQQGQGGFRGNMTASDAAYYKRVESMQNAWRMTK